MGTKPNKKPADRTIDLQRALAIRVAYEMKSGMGLTRESIAQLDKLFGIDMSFSSKMRELAKYHKQI